ncbi:unnamed protein product [Caenorhabditis angaria]|uniref:C3H1-type domain-containing protein n=1 Tax=Caenorhabditis angaria TaxID=860376 RepID=A0A9P1I6V5_9PELO|nr:unnamed protein product [Caenorhabditis angaria]
MSGFSKFKRRIRPADIVITISDEGRTPIGEGNIEELKKLMMESVSEETREEWIRFMERRHHDAMSVLMSDALQTNQTYPKKIKSQKIDSDSQNSTPKPAQKMPNIQENQSNYNEEELKKREILRKQLEKTIRKSDKLAEIPEKSGILDGYGFVFEEEEEENQDFPEEEEECILYKFGHCLNSQNCQFSHEKNIYFAQENQESDLLSDYPIHPPEIELCPGYKNQSCWNFSCEFRHVLYSTDQI